MTSARQSVLLLAAVFASAAEGTVRTASLAADAPLEDSGVYVQNPGCGYAGGGWSTLSTNGLVTVNLSGGNQTKLWSLQQFSKGYVYENQYENYTNKVMKYCGREDIPLNAFALESVSNAFASCRANGGTVIPRFAYTWDGYGGCEPDDFGTLLTHIRQLSEIVSLFRDVIPAVECGIIGAYGEMHTSRYSDPAYQNRIVAAWLAGLPADMPLLVRNCACVVRYFGASTKSELFANAASYDQSQYMRIGFYNDGYLGTDGDYGTWGGGSTVVFTREEGVGFLAPRSNIPYGGEFATITMDTYEKHCTMIYNPEKWNLVKEWYDTHLSYLRTIRSSDMTVYKLLEGLTFTREAYLWDGMPDLHEYEGVDLRTFCEDHMGFRYVVRWTGIDDALADWRGGAGGIVLAVENTGFGRLLFGERHEVVLTKDAETVRVPCEVDAPLSSLGPGAIEQRVFTFALPEGLSAGSWRLHIAARAPLADEEDVLPRRPIRFANAGMWNEDLRANFVGTLTVADAPDGGEGGASTNTAENAWFAVDLSDDAYPAGTAWTSPTKDPAVNLGEFVLNEDSLSALGEADRAVSLNKTEGVRYDPFAQCPARAEVVVKGRVVPEEAESLAVPSRNPLAALGFADSRAWLWDGSVWRRLDDVPVPRFAADFAITADFASADAPRARVSVAGKRSDWIPLKSGTRVKAVVLEGEGKVWSFGGTYRLAAGGGAELVEPVFGGGDGVPAVSYDPQAKTFTVRISNGVAGVTYRALTATDLAGPWKAEGDAVRADADGGVILTIDASEPTKFLKVSASGCDFLR